MKRLIASISIIPLCGCTEINLGMDYVGNKPQKFTTSIDALNINTLMVYRSAKHPGKLWIEPNPGTKIANSWSGREGQFVAMLEKTVEPAYRTAALSALHDQSNCTVDSFIPWPQQFAIEYSFTCR